MLTDAFEGWVHGTEAECAGLGIEGVFGEGFEGGWFGVSWSLYTLGTCIALWGGAWCVGGVEGVTGVVVGEMASMDMGGFRERREGGEEGGGVWMSCWLDVESSMRKESACVDSGESHGVCL